MRLNGFVTRRISEMYLHGGWVRLMRGSRRPISQAPPYNSVRSLAFWARETSGKRCSRVDPVFVETQTRVLQEGRLRPSKHTLSVQSRIVLTVTRARQKHHCRPAGSVRKGHEAGAWRASFRTSSMVWSLTSSVFVVACVPNFARWASVAPWDADAKDSYRPERTDLSGRLCTPRPNTPLVPSFPSCRHPRSPPKRASPVRRGIGPRTSPSAPRSRGWAMRGGAPSGPGLRSRPSSHPSSRP